MPDNLGPHQVFNISSQWGKISIRTITGMLSFVKISTPLKFANFKTIQNTIRQQTKKMFHRTPFLTFNHIRLLDQTISLSSIIKRKTKPNF